MATEYYTVGFTLHEASDLVTEDGNSQSFTECLETNKKKTDAELQFKQLYKQRAPSMHKRRARQCEG